MHMTAKVQFSDRPHTGNDKDGVIPVTVIATGVESFPYTVESRPFVTKVEDIQSVIARPGHKFDSKTIFVAFELN